MHTRQGNFRTITRCKCKRKYNTSIRRENACMKKKILQSEGDVYVKVSATDEKKLIAFCQERNTV